MVAAINAINAVVFFFNGIRISRKSFFLKTRILCLDVVDPSILISSKIE